MKLINYIKLRVAIVLVIYPFYDKLDKWEFFQCKIYSFGNNHNMYRTGKAIGRFIGTQTYKLKVFHPTDINNFKGYAEVKICANKQLGRNTFIVSFVARKLQNEKISNL